MPLHSSFCSIEIRTTPKPGYVRAFIDTLNQYVLDLTPEKLAIVKPESPRTCSTRGRNRHRGFKTEATERPQN